MIFLVTAATVLSDRRGSKNSDSYNPPCGRQESLRRAKYVYALACELLRGYADYLCFGDYYFSGCLIDAYPATRRGWCRCLQGGQPLYLVVFGLMILFFSYFWVATQFNPLQIADDLKKSGGYVPGVRPGRSDGRFS
jgi:hypothetical protein